MKNKIMAVDMFLKLDGVTGESKDKAHTKGIDVLSSSWGMSNSSSAYQGGGAGSGKVNVQEVSVSKYSLDYTPQGGKGAPLTAIPFGWDMAANNKD